VTPAARAHARRLLVAAGVVGGSLSIAPVRGVAPAVAAPPTVASVPPAPTEAPPRSAPEHFATDDVEPGETRIAGSGAGVPPAGTPGSTWRVVGPDGVEQPLTQGEGIQIGRVGDPERPEKIVVPEEVVSRRHAAIRIQHDVVVVVDLGSANGTWIYRDGAHLEVDGDARPAGDGDVVMTTEGVVLATVRRVEAGR
jgi:hypothetical protein